MTKIHEYPMHIRQRIAAVVAIAIGAGLLALLVYVRMHDGTLTKGAKPTILKDFYTTLVSRAQSSFGAK